jgi:hypothetical protein
MNERMKKNYGVDAEGHESDFLNAFIKMSKGWIFLLSMMHCSFSFIFNYSI